MRALRFGPRRRRWFFVAAFALCAVGVGIGVVVFRSPPPPGREALEKMSAEPLIGWLRYESNQGIGSHATAWASGFLAIDEEPEFHGGMLGAPKPAPSPVLRELVRRGLGALPNLLEHLDDKRPTKLVIEHKGRM